jgi:murein DD-endopeptidase MepM/ murein hydrolase activator NlpD
MRDARARWRQRLSERLDRLFAPRELLLRTDGRVSYFTLSRRLQKAVAYTLLGLFLWAVLGTAGFVFDHQRVNSRDKDIARLRDITLRNQELQARVTSLRSDAEALAEARLRARTLATDLDAAGTEIDRLSDDLDQTQTRMARVVEDRASLRAARDELATKLDMLKARMAALQREQQRISDGLTARMQINLDGLEKALAMTTLDLDTLLARAGLRLAGASAPFVILQAGYAPEPRQPVPGAGMLVREIDRFEQMQILLRSLPLSPPLDSYSIQSGFGLRNDPFTRKAAMHEGLDLVNETNTPVLSTAPGVVVYAGSRGDFGLMVEVDHGLGISTRYGHLRAISVNLGQAVAYRQEVGRLGSTGRSTGPHVHYEVRLDGKALDPAKFLEAGRYVFRRLEAAAVPVAASTSVQRDGESSRSAEPLHGATGGAEDAE